jgi:hypothetical protein
MLLSCRGITVGGVFFSEYCPFVIAGLDPAIHAKAFHQSRDCRKSSGIQEAFKVKPFRVRFFDQFDLPFAGQVLIAFSLAIACGATGCSSYQTSRTAP